MSNVAVILSRYMHLHSLFDSWPVYMHYLYIEKHLLLYLLFKLLAYCTLDVSNLS